MEQWEVKQALGEKLGAFYAEELFYGTPHIGIFIPGVGHIADIQDSTSNLCTEQHLWDSTREFSIDYLMTTLMQIVAERDLLFSIYTSATNDNLVAELTSNDVFRPSDILYARGETLNDALMDMLLKVL